MVGPATARTVAPSGLIAAPVGNERSVVTRPAGTASRPVGSHTGPADGPGVEAAEEATAARVMVTVEMTRDSRTERRLALVAVTWALPSDRTPECAPIQPCPSLGARTVTGSSAPVQIGGAPDPRPS